MNPQISPVFDLKYEDKIRRILEDKSNRFMIPEEGISLGERLKLRLSKHPVIFNLDWNDSHRELNNRLNTVMPNISDGLNAIFYLLSNKPLYDGNGNKIDSERQQILEGFIDLRPHGYAEYLDARFELIEGVWRINYNHRIAEDGSLESQSLKDLDLREVLIEDCYVDLTPKSFNEYGLLVKEARSKKQDYVQRENIYYRYPRNGTVARLDAGSDRANLNCGRDPSFLYAWLGVRAKFL